MEEMQGTSSNAMEKMEPISKCARKPFFPSKII